MRSARLRKARAWDCRGGDEGHRARGALAHGSLYSQHMSFAILETGAVVLALLMGLEMLRQRIPWRAVLIRSLIALAVLTLMIVFWRGL
jgi:hypothetical protein